VVFIPDLVHISVLGVNWVVYIECYCNVTRAKTTFDFRPNAFVARAGRINVLFEMMNENVSLCLYMAATAGETSRSNDGYRTVGRRVVCRARRNAYDAAVTAVGMTRVAMAFAYGVATSIAFATMGCFITRVATGATAFATAATRGLASNCS